jgi:hypothetical protein
VRTIYTRVYTSARARIIGKRLRRTELRLEGIYLKPGGHWLALAKSRLHINLSSSALGLLSRGSPTLAFQHLFVLKKGCNSTNALLRACVHAQSNSFPSIPEVNRAGNPPSPGGGCLYLMSHVDVSKENLKIRFFVIPSIIYISELLI